MNVKLVASVKDLVSVHPESPDETLLFPIRKRSIFRAGKEIEGLRGGVLSYVAQTSPTIYAARAKKNRFRDSFGRLHPVPSVLFGPVKRDIRAPDQARGVPRFFAA